MPSAVPVPAAGLPARRRPRLRVAEVAEVRRPAPRWVAVVLTGAVRRVRHTLLDRGVPAHALVTRGYWRAGEQDHPDHDYGDD